MAKKKAKSKQAKLPASSDEHRRFIRHPICYPLKYKVQRQSFKAETANISEGGLMFMSKRLVKEGTMLELELPFLEKVFKVQARVVHISSDDKQNKLYTVGVAFNRIADALKVKLIEQLYLIDEYRHLRSIQLGHSVSMDEASKEWIKLYSRRFKKLYW
jgi:Tfp pilus assembly protein PilZ